MNRRTIGTALAAAVVLVLAAALILLYRADRENTSILVGVPNGEGQSSLAADFTLSKPLEKAAEQNTVIYAMLNAQHSEEDPEGLGQADAVIRMDAEGRSDAPFQYGAFVWLAEDQVLVKTDSGDLRSIAGPDGQALAELVRRQIAPYGQPRTDG